MEKKPTKTTKTYSGRFNLRIEPATHQFLDELSTRKKMSLNMLIKTILDVVKDKFAGGVDKK